MFSKIIAASLKNTKRFLVVWILILFFNQVIIFGACFAPYCLIAALPHTLLFALLINFFLFKNDVDRKQDFTPPVKAKVLTPSKETTDKSRLRRGGILWKTVFFILCIGIFGSLYWFAKKSDQDLAASSEAVASSSLHALAEDVLDDRDYRYKQVHINSTHLETGDDEFDDNDIETYERITKQKYKNSAHNHTASPSQIHNASSSTSRSREDIGARNNAGESAPTSLTYECTNAAGKVGVGTGRLSKENEYSDFLRKEVRAAEYVIFRYQGAGKEYWFKKSKCERVEGHI